MVKEAVVVVSVLQWEDGGIDELVDGGEVGDQVWGVFEIHAGGGSLVGTLGMASDGCI